MRRQRGVEHADLAVGRALDIDLAIGDNQVIGRSLQLVGGHLDQRLFSLARGHDHGIADAMGATAGEGAHAVRRGVGVAGVDRD